MSIRLFSTAVIVDTQGRITISGDSLKQTYAGILFADNLHITWDDGAGFYTTTADKNVHVESDGTCNTSAANTYTAFFGLTSIAGTWNQGIAGNQIVAYHQRDGVDVRKVIMSEYVGGVAQGNTTLVFNWEGTQLWKEAKIDWDAATLTITWYTNAIRTITAFTPQVMSLTKDRALQYVVGQQSLGIVVGSGAASGFEQNFNQITPSLFAGLGMESSVAWLVQRRLMRCH